MSATAITTNNQIPTWYIKSDYVETCNAIVLFHIRSGSYGNTKLDSLDFIVAESWPKAIHEGNGTALLLITSKADEEQRKALIKIASGQAKGDGPFALFAGMFSRLLDPQFVDINVKIDGRKSSFSVPGIINVETESFKHPVTGEEQDTKIQMPKGFIFKLADAANQRQCVSHHLE
jgi:hypothetical protein